MRTRYRRILVVAGVALASMAALAPVAGATKPAPPYEDFAGCPSRAEQPFVADCVKYEFTGGHIGFGKREVSITTPLILRGGFEQETEKFLANSEGGIVPTREPVPGGLIGMTGYKPLDEAQKKNPQLKLYATVELAGAVGSIEEPTLVPIKIHLENPYLGSTCYVGSNANPINLNLTTGTTNPPPPNKPITGTPLGELEEEAGRPEVLIARNGVLVDNAYAVPAASGCVFNYGSTHASIDKYVNAAYGLPSAAGHNTTVLNFNRSLVLPETVYP